MDALLAKATTKDDNPPPVRLFATCFFQLSPPKPRGFLLTARRFSPSPQGYVFAELAKLTHGDITVCDKLADWLGTRLAKPVSFLPSTPPLHPSPRALRLCFARPPASPHRSPAAGARRQVEGADGIQAGGQVGPARVPPQRAALRRGGKGLPA